MGQLLERKKTTATCTNLRLIANFTTIKYTSSTGLLDDTRLIDVKLLAEPLDQAKSFVERRKEAI